MNKKTGERKPLDISSNQRDVTREEFLLHVMLGFPDRHTFYRQFYGDAVPVGPIRLADLEQWVFREQKVGTV